ncbi:unnamed protein product [Cuscuta epithymum]|uniref:Uncharacterized protein n=1 Tax=Cuscuta epithymum TaxID=186058 RepID=A0AAV0GDY6_9ASTE|nr:unnamed protein product [Cuscuta epithymum]
MSVKIGSSWSCVCTTLSSPFQFNRTPRVSSRIRLLDMQHFGTSSATNAKVILMQVVRSFKLMHENLRMCGGLSKTRFILFATSEDPQLLDCDHEPNALNKGNPKLLVKDLSSELVSSTAEAEGRPGFISFYFSRPYIRREAEVLSDHGKNEGNLLWIMGPTVLVASFIFPSLYLRRILATIFEDSLLTDFLILFFTEALFYCGVASFLQLIDHHVRMRRRPPPLELVSSAHATPPFGYTVSSVAVLALSLTIPMVTMGLVWPWTGPAASATLAPFLVGIVVQFAFEQQARHVKSPSWPVIPVVFQVYRLHQLNRAAQLVTALSLTVRGAETTAHNLAINRSLGALLNVLQVLGVICIWSLSSFVMRYFPNQNY